MKRQIESLFVSFSMYSAIPVPRVEWTADNMRFCICYFPLIGVIIGLAANAWFRLCLWAGWGGLLRACVAALLPAALSGGIHVDGMLDTADALGSWQTKERRLEILKDSHTGAFAIIAGIAYFLLLTGVLSEADEREIVLIGLGYILSRAWSGFALVQLKKAKGTGLLRTFSDAAANRRVTVCMVCYLAAVSVLMVLTDPGKGAFCIAASLASFIWYRQMSYHNFGGITGDLAGCFVQVCELAVAAAAALS